MTYASLAARVAIGTAAFALAALAALHLLKPDIHPGRTMISQYALGRYGWLMACCFAAFGAASASLFSALVTQMPSIMGRVGLAVLFVAAVGLAMAARFPMDPVSTPPAQMSFSGRMHGMAFFIGVPSQLLAVLLLSLALRRDVSHSASPLLALTVLIWVSFATMMAIMLIVGPGKTPDPKGPERFLGAPNRLFMVAYGVWLMIAAWPFTR